MKLKNKIAIITGATSGIGKAIASEFLQNGATICIGYYKKDKEYLQTHKDFSKYEKENKVKYYQVDVSNLKNLKHFYEKITKDHKTLDILVNNAGCISETSFWETNEKIWNKEINTNLRGQFFSCRYFAELIKPNQNAVILNIASVAGLYPRANHIEYGISKAGVIYITKSLSQVLAPNIRVNAIAPGYTKTKLMKFWNDRLEIKKNLDKIPLRRFNDPTDIAKGALFLVSEDARNITGEIMVIDGGKM